MAKNTFMPNIIILQGEYSTNDNKIDRKQFYNAAFTLPFIFRCLYKLGKKTRNRFQKRKIIIDCYIASVNTKRDWLICSHVALDKCNVSRPGNK